MKRTMKFNNTNNKMRPKNIKQGNKGGADMPTVQKWAISKSKNIKQTGGPAQKNGPTRENSLLWVKWVLCPRAVSQKGKCGPGPLSWFTFERLIRLRLSHPHIFCSAKLNYPIHKSLSSLWDPHSELHYKVNSTWYAICLAKA